MFFLVTHRWEKGSEAEVSSNLIGLLRRVWYGGIGDPWPKLFYMWFDPKSPTAYALWESSTPGALKEVLDKLDDIATEFVHVKQLFPPHVDLYHVAKITTE